MQYNRGDYAGGNLMIIKGNGSDQNNSMPWFLRPGFAYDSEKNQLIFRDIEHLGKYRS